MRLFTGLVLFSYAATHLISHATGLFLLDRMEQFGRGVLLAPWRTFAGRWLLIGSLVVHGGLGLVALWRRRHLVMPAEEALQLALGLTIPLLLLPHITNVRLGYSLYGLDDSYFRILYQYWITSPLLGLTRQFLLMTALWVHGCLGIYMWLRFRPWWRRCSGGLLGIAIAVPVLAMLGIVNAGWDTTFRSLLEPGFAALHGPPPPGTVDAARRETLERLWQGLQIGYAAMLISMFAARGMRARLANSRSVVTVRYPGRTVTVPRGYSLLEASRLARLAHASVCGGRARCSTCRVQVVSGLADLPQPNPLEQGTLRRIQAPPTVRLACQTRPVADISIVPLVSTEPQSERSLGIAFAEARECLVTALAVDLRESTGLAQNNLPFDALYVVDQYIRVATAAIHRHGGYVTSVAGDGVMSAFGVDNEPKRGALGALKAARDLWRELMDLDELFTQNLQTRVRFGIGLHSGVAIVGAVARSGRSSIQFLGDTGNVASRLESLTKEKACTAIASVETLALAGLSAAPPMREESVLLRGRDAALPVVLMSEPDQLSEALDRGTLL